MIVLIHWGLELDTQPRDYQVEDARRMIDAGADAIIGHHAHRLQPMDTYKGAADLLRARQLRVGELAEGSTTERSACVPRRAKAPMESAFDDVLATAPGDGSGG